MGNQAGRFFGAGKLYPLVNQHSYWKWPFIVDLPSYKMVIFHSYVSYQKDPEGTKYKRCGIRIEHVDNLNVD
jgi:hypothetical protein